MKKKNVTYLLLVLVAAIWGYLFYKFFSDLNPEKVIEANSNPIQFAKIEETKDSVYALMANYRDPFLGKGYVQNNSSGISIKRFTSPKPKPIPVLTTVSTMVWPDVKYLGLISHNANAKHMGIITINGKEYTITEGEVIQEFKILKLSKSNATLIYKGVEKVIGRG